MSTLPVRLYQRLRHQFWREKEDRPIWTWAKAILCLVTGASSLALGFMPNAPKLVAPFGALILVFGVIVVSALRTPIPADFHEVTVAFDEPDYWASCRCGWSGDIFDSKDPAFQEAFKHSPRVKAEIDDWGKIPKDEQRRITPC